MTHTTDDDTPRATALAMPESFRHFALPIAAVLGAIRAFRHRADVAHTARCTRAAFGAQNVQDSGLDPSDATGIASWQPDLPFFMQSGFGRK